MDRADRIWLCELAYSILNQAIYTLGDTDQIIFWRKGEREFRKELAELAEDAPSSEQGGERK